MDFQDITSFMNRLREIPLIPPECNSLNALLNLYNNLNNGCKCQSHSRNANFHGHLNNLPNVITQTEKDFLKTSLNTENIIVTNIWTISLT